MITRLFLTLTFFISVCVVSHTQGSNGYDNGEFGVREVDRLLLNRSKESADGTLTRKGYSFTGRNAETGIYFYSKPGTQFTAKFLLKNGVVRLFVWNEIRENTRTLFYEIRETKFEQDKPGELTWTNSTNEQILMFQWQPENGVYNILMGYDQGK